MALALVVCATDQQAALPLRTLVSLAVAHVRAEIQQYPQAALPGLDLEHPQVLARNGGARTSDWCWSELRESRLARWGAIPETARAYNVCVRSRRAH